MSLSGQTLSTVLPVSSASCLAPRHCHAPPRTLTNECLVLPNTSRGGAEGLVFPADPVCLCLQPRRAALPLPHPPLPLLSDSFVCPFPSVGCSAPHAGRQCPWGPARTDAGAPLTSKAPSKGANSAHGSYMRGKEKPCDMGKESLRCPW